MKPLLLLVLILTSSIAHASRMDGEGDRNFEIFAGFGVGRMTSSLELGGGKSQFDGWAPGLEVGLSLPWSKYSGVALSGELKQFDLTNTQGGSNSVERAVGLSTSAKLAVFFGRFAVGGGLSQGNFNVRQVSTATGVSEVQITGPSSLVFASFNLNIKPAYRLSFEGQHQSGELGRYKYGETSGMMKFFILLDL